MTVDAPGGDDKRKPIRSYVLRGGRITSAQRRAHDKLLPRWGLAFSPAPIDLDAVYGRRAPRVLEIGFGDGATLIELAGSRPETDFLGVEVHPPGIGHLLLGIEARSLTNLRVIVHDAVEVLQHQIPPASLDEVLLYFPDPWPKKRHHKRRIVQPAFAALVADRLKPGGALRLATDWEPYAEWMLEVLNAERGLVNAATDQRWVERPTLRGATRFEARGHRLGHRVFDLEYRRPISGGFKSMAHVAPLPREAVPEFRELFDHYANTRGFVPNSILTMSRRPAIAKAFMDLNRAVLYEGTVPEELKMLVSLIASQAAGCRYCQAHMANLSSIYRASDAKIAAVWEFETSELFSDAERAALRLALKGATVPNEAGPKDFVELAKYFDDGEKVEIVATIALFGYLNRWNDTMATDLEERAARVAGRTLGPAGWDAGKHGARS